MLRKALMIGTVLALLLVIVAGTALAADDAVKGKTLWDAKNCKSCHGALGEGKYAGPRAGDTRTAADWVKQARTPRANMPSYTVAQVGDQDLADMLAYMKTLTAPASFTAVAYTPAANDPQGKILFNQKRCAACHGDGIAFVKSRFTDKSLTVSAAAVMKQLRTPAANMPSFAATQVTDADASAIASWLATLAAPAALPKTGDQLPLGLIVLSGIGLVALGVGVTLFARRSA